MKTAAIIAEYNPFHNGHLYHLNETRRQTGADFILVIMSGDFVQRGAPAIVNKFIRTKMALLGGADIVIELPSLYALSSAEFFAGGAVTLLNHLNVVDFLSFGSESGNLSFLESSAHILVEKDHVLRPAINRFLKEGYSYPAARTRALTETLAKISLSDFSDTASNGSFSAASDRPQEIFMKHFGLPNNILGLEYCKALIATNSTIRPFTLKRTDRGYHNTSTDTSDSADDCGLASASAIRRAISDQFKSVSNYMPEKAFSLLDENYIPITEDSFSHLLHYKLLTEASSGFSEYLDCMPDLSDKICKNLPYYNGFSSFCALLKSKDLTYTRISRVLMHILLNIKAPKAFNPSLTERELLVPYARLLGFRQGSEPLLAAIKKDSSIPLLSKLADARFLLDEEAFALLQQDIYCASVYESVLTQVTGRPMPNEWKTSPVIL